MPPTLTFLLCFFPGSHVIDMPVLQEDITGIWTAFLDQYRIRPLMLGRGPGNLGPDTLKILHGVQSLQGGFGAQIFPDPF